MDLFDAHVEFARAIDEWLATLLAHRAQEERLVQGRVNLVPKHVVAGGPHLI